MKIQLKRSNVIEGGSAKEPTAAQMEYGELAVNYNGTDPALFIKDSSDNIVRLAGAESISGETPGDGTITIKQPGTADQTFTVNQTGNTEINLKNDNTVVTPGNGALTIKTAGQGASATGTFTANQSSGSTLTLPAIRYQDLSGALWSSNASGNVYPTSTTANVLVGGTNNSEAKIFLRDDGTASFASDVKIHSTSTNTRLSVRGDASADYNALHVYDNTSVATINPDFLASFRSYGQRSGETGSGAKGGIYVQAGFNRGADIARFSAISSGYVDTPVMVIKDTKNVGIGTTDPQDRLHLSTTGTTTLKVESTATTSSADTASVVLKNDTKRAASIKNLDLSDNVLWSLGRKYNGGASSYDVDFDVNGRTVTSTSGSNGRTTFNEQIIAGQGIQVLAGNPATIVNGLNFQNGDPYIVAQGKANTRFTGSGIRYTGPNDGNSVAPNILRVFDGYRTGGSNNQKVNNQFTAAYQDTDLSPTTNQTVVQIRPGILGNQTVSQGGITLIQANTASLDRNLQNVNAFNCNLERSSSTTTETKFVINSTGTAPSFHRGKLYLSAADTNVYQYNDQNFGLKAIVNDPSEPPIEISSVNSGNNNTKSAISFTKTDYTKSPGQSGYIAEAGYIRISAGVGANSGMIYSCGANTTNSGFVSTSDYRLKTDITAMPSAVDRLKLLKPKTYKWIGTDEVVDGFLAHEVTPACSAAVFGQKDAVEQIGTITDHTGVVVATDVPEPSSENLEYTEEVEVTPAVAYVAATYDEEGNELTPEQEPEEAVTQTITHTKTWTATGTRPAYQSIDQTKLIPLLTKALQEALERIEVLEATINS